MRKVMKLSESDLRRAIRKLISESDYPEHKDVGMYNAVPSYSSDSRDVGLYPAVPGEAADDGLDPLALKDIKVLNVWQWLNKYPDYDIVDYIK